MDVRGPAESHDANNNISQVRGSVRFESAESSPSSKPPMFTTHVESPGIVRLTQQLKELPEVREELVAQTIAKLREGYFSTPESAERTAEAILGSFIEE